MITELDKLLTHGTHHTANDYKIKKKSILMNTSRCVIFEYLCLHPCSTVTAIAKGLSVSESSVRWHLDKLILERFVTVKDNGSTIFFPTNMINPDHIDIFRLMAMDKSSAIIKSIDSKKGVYQNEISKKLELNIRTIMKYTSDLEYYGIIRCANDGKYKRYYMTGLIDDLKEYYRRHSKHFKEYIIKKTRRDGLRPKIMLSTPDLLRLKLEMGGDIKVLTLPLIPFGAAQDSLESMRKKRFRYKNPLITWT
jgi:DNA-binding transcriptional ArsR family regulator